MSSARFSLLFVIAAGASLAWAQIAVSKAQTAAPPGGTPQITAPSGGTAVPPLPGASPVTQADSNVAQALQDAATRAQPPVDQIEFVENGNDLIARIPLNLDPGKSLAANSPPALRGVHYVGSFSTPLAPAIKVELIGNALEENREINVTAAAAQLPPGTYRLQIALRVNAESGTTAIPAFQQLSPNLLRPAPMLSADQNISLWVGYDSAMPATLTLREGDHKAAARGITFTEIRDLAGMQESKSARLEIMPRGDVASGAQRSDSPRDIPADKAITYEVKAAGEFPVGKTTGKIVVRAANLARPLIVDYTVNVRRSLGLIAVCAVIGAVAGWFVRIQLQAKQVLYQAAAEASKTMAALTEAGHVRDRSFQTTIDDAKKKLRDDARSSNPETIRAAIAAAQVTLAAAENRLRTDIGQIALQLGPWNEVLAAHWMLPAPVNDQLEAARSAARMAAQLLDERNASEADHILREKVLPPAAALANAAGSWRDDCSGCLQALAKNPPTMVEQGADRLKTAVDAWIAEYKHSDSRGMVSVPELNKVLTDTHAAFDQALRIVDNLGVWGREMTDWARKQLPTAAQVKANNLRALVAEHAKSISAVVNDPGSAKKSPETRVMEQQQAWRDFLNSALGGKAVPKEVEEEIVANRWTEAVKQVHAAVAQQRMQMGVFNVLPAGTPVVTMSAAPTAGPIGQPDAETPRVRPAVSALLAPLGPILGTPREQRVFLRQAKMAAGLQSACIAVIYVAAAYAIFSESWTGTWREMFIIFSWAFALDLSADVLSAVIRRVNPVAVV